MLYIVNQGAVKRGPRRRDREAKSETKSQVMNQRTMRKMKSKSGSIRRDPEIDSRSQRCVIGRRDLYLSGIIIVGVIVSLLVIHTVIHFILVVVVVTVAVVDLIAVVFEE
jgi:hypothetical protein